MKEVTVQIPEGAEPGDTLTLEIDGAALEIEVPAGAVVGDVLSLQIATDPTVDEGDKAEGSEQQQQQYEEEEGGKGDDQQRPNEQQQTSILLASGKQLQMPQPAEQGHIEEGAGDIDAQDESCDGTHRMLWPSARKLIELVGGSNAPQQVKDLLGQRNDGTVIELGSGLGYAGLVVGHMLAQYSLRKSNGSGDGDENGSAGPNDSRKTLQVFLTDVPAALPALQRSVNGNRSLCDDYMEVQCLPLQWGSTEPNQALLATADWIVASDVLYNHKYIPQLVATVQRLVRDSTRILIAVRWRKPQEERVFFDSLSDVVRWELMPGSACPLSWKEYGNPACEASNKYFSQTSVGVAGKPTPLADIDEAANQRMYGDEYEAWENLQVQIYLGTVISPSAGP